MQAMDHAAMVVRSRGLQDSFSAVARLPSRSSPPSPGTRWAVARVGAAVADFRIAADNAKLGQPEILLGLIPAPAAPAPVPF